MIPPGRLIYDTPGLQVIYQPANSDVLVFSFNPGDFNRTGMGFFGSSFFAKRGFASVGFIDTRSGWFPAGAMRKAIAAVDAQVRRPPGTRVLSYGISMGAYGALKYSGRLGCHASLAFGPQWSMDPTLVGHFDRRYEHLFTPAIHAGMRVTEADLCDRNYIFFDPLAPEDLEHARILGDMRNMHRVNCTFLGHPTIQYFTETRLIDKVFALALRHSSPPREFRTLIRSRRAESAKYWLGRADYLRTRKSARWREEALRSYAESVRLNRLPADHREALDPLIGLINALIEAKRMPEARAQAELLYERALTRPYAPDVRDVLVRAKATERAVALVDAALARQPNNAEIRIDLARTYLAIGNKKRARRELDRAREDAGDHPLSWRRLEFLYRRLGCEDDAVAAAAAFAAATARRSPTGSAASAKAAPSKAAPSKLAAPAAGPPAGPDYGPRPAAQGTLAD